MYMPHGNYSDTDIGAVPECLDDDVACARSKSPYLLLACDFNCRSAPWEVGDEQDTIGRLGTGKQARTHVDQLVYALEFMWCKHFHTATEL